MFVADSQWDKMEENVESFKNLEENLRRQGTSLDQVPYVLQYNKRDMPNMAPTHYLEYLLNNRAKRAKSFAAVATNGQGVFATLNMISRLLLQKFTREMETRSASETPSAASAGTSNPMAINRSGNIPRLR